MMRWVEPNQLQDLFPVLGWLQRGESVVIMPPGDLVASDALPDVRIGCPASHRRLGNWVGLWSSGTTRRPKLVCHSWEKLSSAIRHIEARATCGTPWSGRRSESPPKCWASPFEPWTYAGFQVALCAWATGGQVISFSNDWTSNAKILREYRPDGFSVTPTFIGLLMRLKESEICTPSHIAVGGEPISVGLGAQLPRRFPTARFTAIYASTELGILMRSRRIDGWYPAISLSKRFREWRILSDVLWVRVDDVWQSTGDLVDYQNGWMRVIGRSDRIANVAGEKVRLDEVGERALEVPGVKSAVAFAQFTGVTGQVVGLRFSIDETESVPEIRGRLERHLRLALPKPAWPRYWEIGECATANGKTVSNREQWTDNGSGVCDSGAPLSGNSGVSLCSESFDEQEERQSCRDTSALRAE